MNKYTLKALRANKNMTQEETAEALKVSTTTWSKWENGKRSPTVDKALEIAELFGVSFDDIIFL